MIIFSSLIRHPVNDKIIVPSNPACYVLLPIPFLPFQQAALYRLQSEKFPLLKTTPFSILFNSYYASGQLHPSDFYALCVKQTLILLQIFFCNARLISKSVLCDSSGVYFWRKKSSEKLLQMQASLYPLFMFVMTQLELRL